VLHLEQVVGGPLDVFCDLMAVRRAKKEGPQNQHVQRPLQQLDSVWHLDSRHSTQIGAMLGRRTTEMMVRRIPR
jgi:hypothetical protein